MIVYYKSVAILSKSTRTAQEGAHPYQETIDNAATDWVRFRLPAKVIPLADLRREGLLSRAQAEVRRTVLVVSLDYTELVEIDRFQ